MPGDQRARATPDAPRSKGLRTLTLTGHCQSGRLRRSCITACIWQLPAPPAIASGEKAVASRQSLPEICLLEGLRAMKEQKGSVSTANRFTQMKRITGICVLLMVPSLAHSQAKQLVDLAVTCKESVGNSFIFQFKEAIRSSASYTLTPK